MVGTLQIESVTIRGATLFVDANHSNGSVCQIHPTAAHADYPRLPRDALDPWEPAPPKTTKLQTTTLSLKYKKYSVRCTLRPGTYVHRGT